MQRSMITKVRCLQMTGSALAALALGACHTVSPTVATGEAAIETIGVAQPGLVSAQTRISPADELRIQVLYEPELSADAVKVEGDGGVPVAFLGKVAAAGKTTDELAADIAQGLERYLNTPQVLVSFASQAQQVVTVEGSVEAPGVYPVTGTSSLLKSLALASGPRRTAALDEVIVFRTVNGERMAAVFDLEDIRYGHSPDPLILGGDTIVVGNSAVKGAFRDFLTAAPAIGVFRPY